MNPVAHDLDAHLVVERDAFTLDVALRQDLAFGYDLLGRAAAIAGSTAPAFGPNILQRLGHGRENLGILTLAEIVIRAPNHNILLASFGAATGMGKLSLLSLDVGEDTIAPLGANTVDCLAKCLLIIHGQSGTGPAS